VSLAAALAIPLTLQSGAPFPYRDAILVIVFGVIVVTLVGQGLMMPAVMRWLGLAQVGQKEQQHEKEAELNARHGAVAAAERRLQELAGENGLKQEVAAHLRARNDQRTLHLPKTLSDGWDIAAASATLRLELIKTEREYIHSMLRAGKITDESRRLIERELDLEAASIACKREAYDPPL
jgi:CPA1 family monovalent cation:H+ antiporter